MANVFVSYAREDTQFVRKLTEALQKNELDLWVDWEDIEPTVDWMNAIEKGIEEADTFVAIVSPDWLQSIPCNDELNLAIKNGKRLIPVLPYDLDWDSVPKVLSHLNYVFLRERDNFEASLQKLLTAIRTDYDWVQQHRWLQVRALDWQRNNKDHGSLLRGKDLQDAEFQLATNSSKQPLPTDLQREYVFESRKATDSQRRRTTSIAVAGVIALTVLTVVAIVMAVRATRQAKIARSGELAAQSAGVREQNLQVSLLLGVEAYKLWDTVQTRGNLLDATTSNSALRQYLVGHQDTVLSLAFSPDGQTLATDGSDNMIILWNVKTGQVIGKPLRGHTGFVQCLVFSPDGKMLASGAGDASVMLWDVASGHSIGAPIHLSQAAAVLGGVNGVFHVAFSRDRNKIAFSGTDGIGVWDVASQRLVKEQLSSVGNFSAASIAFSPDGNVLMIAKSDGMSLWNLGTDEFLDQPISEFSSTGTTVFSPDGRILASADTNGIALWSIDTQQSIGLLPAMDVQAFAFSQDDSRIATVNSGKTISLWDVGTLQQMGSPLTGAISINSIALNKDATLLASGGADKNVILWDVAGMLDPGPRPRSSMDIQIKQNSSIASIAYSADAKTLISGGEDGNIYFWDAIKGVQSRPTIQASSSILSLSFSPDGKTIASGSVDEVITLWNASSGKQIGETLQGSRVGFSSDGKILATMGTTADSGVKIWDVGTSKLISDITAGAIFTFTPDGKTLAAGSGIAGEPESFIGLWNTETGKSIGDAISVPTTSFFSSFAFSPDGKILAMGMQDNTILLLDMSTGKLIGQPLTAHTANVRAVAFSPDGKTLVSGSDDGTIILWDVATAQPIGAPLTGHRGAVTSIAFNPVDGGKTLASGSEDGTIIVWNLDLAAWVEKSCERAGRNLTRAEWAKYFPNDHYPTTQENATCPQWSLATEPVPTPTPLP